jgi:hypothetical protein
MHASEIADQLSARAGVMHLAVSLVAAPLDVMSREPKFVRCSSQPSN